MAKVELSDFQRKFFAQGTEQQLFTAKEFEEGMAQAKAEIMAVAIQTTKQAIQIERQACAEVCKRLAEQEDEGELSTALVNASMAIMNRMHHAN
jgi:hypothetical protein